VCKTGRGKGQERFESPKLPVAGYQQLLVGNGLMHALGFCCCCTVSIWHVAQRPCCMVSCHAGCRSSTCQLSRRCSCSWIVLPCVTRLVQFLLHSASQHQILTACQA